MLLELTEQCQQSSCELAYNWLKATRWNKCALAMTHALFSVTTKVLNSFDYDDKEGYFVRKIMNKLILISV